MDGWMSRGRAIDVPRRSAGTNTADDGSPLTGVTGLLRPLRRAYMGADLRLHVSSIFSMCLLHISSHYVPCLSMSHLTISRQASVIPHDPISCLHVSISPVYASPVYTSQLYTSPEHDNARIVCTRECLLPMHGPCLTILCTDPRDMPRFSTRTPLPYSCLLLLPPPPRLHSISES